MGKNNRARRAAKAKAKNRPRVTGSQSRDGDGADPSVPTSFGMLDSVAQVIRQNCSTCGSPDLEWMTAGELPDKAPPHKRGAATEGLSFFGADAQGWLCGSCGGFGLMPTT